MKFFTQAMTTEEISNKYQEYADEIQKEHVVRSDEIKDCIKKNIHVTARRNKGSQIYNAYSNAKSIQEVNLVREELIIELTSDYRMIKKKKPFQKEQDIASRVAMIELKQLTVEAPSTGFGISEIETSGKPNEIIFDVGRVII